MEKKIDHDYRWTVTLCHTNWIRTRTTPTLSLIHSDNPSRWAANSQCYYIESESEWKSVHLYYLSSIILDIEPKCDLEDSDQVRPTAMNIQISILRRERPWFNNDLSECLCFRHYICIGSSPSWLGSDLDNNLHYYNRRIGLSSPSPDWYFPILKDLSPRQA